MPSPNINTLPLLVSPKLGLLLARLPVPFASEGRIVFLWIIYTMQQQQEKGPTLRNARLMTTHDAAVVCWAVAKDELRLITRRLNSEERKQLKSGDIFVWEERVGVFEGDVSMHALGIERWTDGMSWGPSRMRNEFLYYHQKDTKIGVTSPLPSNGNSKPTEKDRLVKQSYSVRVKLPGEDNERKWHVTAYFTENSLDSLNKVEDLEQFKKYEPVPTDWIRPTRTREVKKSDGVGTAKGSTGNRTPPVTTRTANPSPAPAPAPRSPSANATAAVPSAVASTESPRPLPINYTAIRPPSSPSTVQGPTHSRVDAVRTPPSVSSDDRSLSPPSVSPHLPHLPVSSQGNYHHYHDDHPHVVAVPSKRSHPYLSTIYTPSKRWHGSVNEPQSPPSLHQHQHHHRPDRRHERENVWRHDLAPLSGGERTRYTAAAEQGYGRRYHHLEEDVADERERLSSSSCGSHCASSTNNTSYRRLELERRTSRSPTPPPPLPTLPVPQRRRSSSSPTLGDDQPSHSYSPPIQQTAGLALSPYRYDAAENGSRHKIAIDHDYDRQHYHGNRSTGTNRGQSLHQRQQSHHHHYGRDYDYGHDHNQHFSVPPPPPPPPRLNSVLLSSHAHDRDSRQLVPLEDLQSIHQRRFLRGGDHAYYMRS